MSKFLKVAFYAIGTFLLVFSSVIVGANFVKDSGVFDKPIVQVIKQPQKAPATASTPKVVIVTEPVKQEPVKQTPAASTVNNKKLVVEVINYTDKSGLAEETRAMLEAKGYTVSAGNYVDSKQGTSQIIIRKKGVNTDVIRNMLKISVIKEELQPDSRFDVTIIIGSDFNP
ncbi:MAG TPA: LytR C-terminal domain-containing protein [Ruminiclostridium sp.]